MKVVQMDEGETYLFAPSGLDIDPDQPRQDQNWDIPGTAANIINLRERGLGIKGTGVMHAVTIRLPLGALDENGQIKPGTRPIIVDGEGRQRSAIFANEQKEGSIPFLPCTFQDVSPDDAFEIAYFANAHSRPMSPVDDAMALLRIKKRYNIGYDKLAERTNHTKDYVRDRLKAIGDEDTLPILEKRSDSLSMVRRINQVPKSEFREELIKMALAGAPFIDIEDSIAARRQGLTLERYRAEKAVRKAEIANQREAQSAKSYKPHSAGSGIRISRSTVPTVPAVSPSAPPIAPPPPPVAIVAPEQSAAPPPVGIEVRPFVGDALDSLLRAMRSARDGLAEAQLSDDRRDDLARKAYELRDVSFDLIAILERAQVHA